MIDLRQKLHSTAGASGPSERRAEASRVRTALADCSNAPNPARLPSPPRPCHSPSDAAHAQAGARASGLLPRYGARLDATLQCQADCIHGMQNAAPSSSPPARPLPLVVGGWRWVPNGEPVRVRGCYSTRRHLSCSAAPPPTPRWVGWAGPFTPAPWGLLGALDSDDNTTQPAEGGLLWGNRKTVSQEECWLSWLLE